MTDQLSYVVGGRTFSGCLATPTGAPHEHERMERLAQLGFAAYAPDLFGEVFADRARGMAVIAEPTTGAADPRIASARTGGLGRRCGSSSRKLSPS